MISKDWAFQTHHCITQSIGDTNYSCNWSLPSACFVNGIVICFNTPNPFATGSSPVMPARASLEE